ncbi:MULTISPECIES: non-hydrolyzing UDP-N-acetylglucosamine 2-epimerase [Olivibacter]|uniref:Non-hydrolyzing UDP-N-acetylglucosamine 2-epimerase n=1 Tax=Olivibacter jilunii TaxID=985016 RepID=A0ABW6BBF1_9SPHI|nr:UDP-N-acetylglucosamine 2-epimerase (non-hydrolyzing) [Pseudosphingobacterium sp.]
MKKIISIVGARPQFIKHAPIQIQLKRFFNDITVHTGQHYDENMSQVFFEELNISRPDYLFDIGGSKPQGEQTGIMMAEIEKVCIREKPHALLVYGDTNSTLAGTLVAAKMQIPLIHIEAGLRSYNMAMPEEVNRIIADRFAYLLFCPTIEAVENLKKEGINYENVFVSGDVMCDMLKLVENRAKALADYPYYFVTLHRPYNTDNKERLLQVLNHLNKLDWPVVFPMHPRTVTKLNNYGFKKGDFRNINIISPVGYIESISWQKFALAVITDSGGIQKEAYMLKKRCITIRTETEWKETLKGGWNTLLYDNLECLQENLNKPLTDYQEDLYGKGNAAEEIVQLIKQRL